MSKAYAIPVFQLAYMPSRRDADIHFGDEPSLTKQAMADECDINRIMAQFEKTGMLTHVNTFQGEYADLGDAPSFHDAMNRVVAAQEAFDSLPAGVRARFGNDPASFLDFVSNADRSEMEKLGLLPSDVGAERAHNAGEASTSEEPVKAPKAVKKASVPPSEEGG